MIQAEGLGKNFGGNKVLRSVSLDVRQGDIFGIVGPSGAGKSTLLRCLNGLETYDKGSVKVMGREVKDLSPKDLKTLRRDMGMIFQNFSLMSRKNVFQNVTFPMEVWGYEKKRSWDRAEELLEVVGLSDKKDERVKNLSGGQKQRVGIARALALNPKILLCDEATSALDPKTTISILQLLLDINKKMGVTIIAVTHQMEVVKTMCNRLLVLDKGQVIESGETEKVFLLPGESLKNLMADDYAVMPSGINVRLSFPKRVANDAVMARMARELGLNFSIVGGKIEKYRDEVMGFLIINIAESDLDKTLKYLSGQGVLWEVYRNVK